MSRTIDKELKFCVKEIFKTKLRIKENINDKLFLCYLIN